MVATVNRTDRNSRGRLQPLADSYDFGISYGRGVIERKFSLVSYYLPVAGKTDGNGRYNNGLDDEYKTTWKMETYFNRRRCRKFVHPVRYYRYVMKRCGEAEKMLSNFEEWLKS